jgi:superfamily II DNA/RNA helicase
MADMGFLPEVRRLLDLVRTDRQTLLFSATLDGDVNVLITRYQRNPSRAEVVSAEDAPSNTHVFWRVERPQRVNVTASLVGESWPSIVFCRTKRGADRVARQLTASGVSATAIHGDLSQSQRERALASFQGGRIQALVATDIAARGIHVDKVASVVHYDLPADEKDYVHRSGRTGRAGETGLVVALVGGEDVAAARKLQSKLQLPKSIDAPTFTGVTMPPPAKTEAETPKRPHVPRPSTHRPDKHRPAGAQSRRPTTIPRKKSGQAGGFRNGRAASRRSAPR